MASIDWAKALDLKRAVQNVETEFPGDWYQDPWGWPELAFMQRKRPDLVVDNCATRGTMHSALIDVPKENWGTRPAVVLDITDRLTYQALVDRLSVDLIGRMSPNAFGWRLPAGSPKRGEYSHNDKQWDGYRTHLNFLSSWKMVALRTDLVAFFASIPVDELQDAIQHRCPSSAITRRLCDMVAHFDATPDRSGLPQRSTSSAVLANMFLAPLDDVLGHHASSMPRLFASKVTYKSFARWMDDMWLFCDDPAAARRAQMDLQGAAHSLGLYINFAKTDVLEGSAVEEQAKQIEHSAVDDAIDNRSDFQPLEELIDRLLENPEKAGRTSVRFAAKRMRDNGHTYKVQDIVAAAERMPHVADAWSRLFKQVFTHRSLQDWYLNYAKSDWATHEWSVAHYARMFPTRGPRTIKALRDFFSEAIQDANTSLPMLAVACQRLSAWDQAEARAACSDAFRRSSTPQARRVLALSALAANETRTKVRKWLRADKENAPTLAMLDVDGT